MSQFVIESWHEEYEEEVSKSTSPTDNDAADSDVIWEWGLGQDTSDSKTVHDYPYHSGDN